MLTVTESGPTKWLFTIFTTEYNKNFVDCLVFLLDKNIFAFISDQNVHICNSETGHLILDPFMHLLPEYTCFSPNGTHILDRYNNSAAIWNIERGEEQFRIEG